MATGNPDNPIALKSILAALDSSDTMKHWRNPPKEFGTDHPEFLEYNRNDLTDPGDLSMISFTEEFAFGESSSDDSDEVDGNIKEEEDDDERPFLDDLPPVVVTSQEWLDPAEVTKEKNKIPSLEIAKQARHQNMLLRHMQELQLQDECRKIAEQKTVSRYQNYLRKLGEIRQKHKMDLEKYCQERDRIVLQEETRLRKQEEEIQRAIQQDEQEYTHYIRQKSLELSKLVEDAERREAEQRNLIQGLVNELLTLKNTFIEKHEQVKQLLRDLNGDQSLGVSVETMRNDAIKPVTNAIESATKGTVTKNDLADIKKNLQMNVNYLDDFIQALNQKKEERAQQEAEQISNEETQARLKAEQEKQQLLAKQNEPVQVNPVETSEENRQASVLSIARKRYEDLKKKMEDHINIQTNMDNERKKEVGRITTISNQLDNLNQNINREKLQKLLAYLGGRSIQHNDKKYSTNNDPTVIAYAKFRLIKDMLKIPLEMQIREGAGFAAYAWLIVNLISVHSDLWEIFLYHIYTTCPYLVPLCIFPKEGQSEDEYDKERGKKPKEKFDMYLSRMGNAALLFGLVLSKMWKKNGMPEEAPVVGWKLLAGLLTLDPSPGVSAEVLRGILLGVGSNLQQTYGKQFTKLLHYAMGPYLTQVSEVSAISEQGSSSCNQLVTYFEEYKKNNKLSQYEYTDKFN